MAGEDDDGDVVMLLDPVQLGKLVALLLHQEEALMTRIASEPEREKYLKSCNDAYDKVISLMDDAQSLVDKYNNQEGGDNKDKAKIAQEILEYIKYGMNMSMQCIRNCCLRVTCLDKINTHFNSLTTELEDLDMTNVTEVESLAKEVSTYKQCMWEYTNKCRSGSARALSKAYSMLLKQEGIKFPDLVEKHKNELGFEGEFEDLEEIQKLEVYNSIIEESGRATIPTIELASASLGVAMLVVTASMMVWDIFTAEHKLEAVLQNSLSVLSEVGAFAVQVMVEGAVADLELGVFIVSLAGFAVGSVVGLLFVVASGALLDLIFNSGGNTAPDVSELMFHSADMPDGMALAYQIAHGDL